MESSRNVIMVISIVIFSFIALIFYKRVTKKIDNQITIGILQTASHPALDAARDGFVKVMQESLADKVNFVVRNGQGNISNIHTIAQQFHAKQDIDAIFAIATPAAQAITSVEKEKPVIIAAVSVSPQLSDIFSAPNICGTSDMIDVRREIEAMKGLLPQEFKKVGILFCNAEVNAVAMSRVMITELERAGYIPVSIGLSSEADIEPAMLAAARNVDVFLSPTDNMVASAIALIVDITRKVNKPFIVSDNMLVKYGPLMARGVDYYESGKQAASVALQVLLNHKKPSDLTIIPADNKEIFVNKQIIDEFGFTIADAIVADVVLV